MKRIFMDELTDFIIRHEEDDPATLLLSRSKWPEIDMNLAVCTIQGRRKLRKKVPQWYGCPALTYPTRLCTEQCSSEETAFYKASLAERMFAGREYGVADLTGGLGVDSWAFSLHTSKVLYNEMDQVLSRNAERNFKELGRHNISVSYLEAVPGGIGAILGDFSPDLIFMDPSRRKEDGSKVFLIEDCRPDIYSMQDELLGLCPNILLKISPMADISSLMKKLKHIREIHVVASAGECREILVWLDREHKEGEPEIIASEHGTSFSFYPGEAAGAVPEFPANEAELYSYKGGTLFEPGKALAKSGAFNLTSSLSGLPKLAPSTHLYIAPPAETEQSKAPQPLETMQNPQPSQGQSGSPLALCKEFLIKDIVPLNNRNLKETGRLYPHSEVTASNIPLDSEALRKRLGVRSGEDAHIFGAKVSFSASRNTDNYLIITERIH